MPGVTATSVCLPCAPTTVTSVAPEAVVTIAATGTVSTGPSVCPVSTVTRTFSPFSAAGSGLDGCTVSGMNGGAPGLAPPPELLEPAVPADPEPAVPEPVDPAPVDPAEPADTEPPPTFTIVPTGAMVVAVPRSAMVPAAWMPVTSSKIFTFRPALTCPAYAGGSSPVSVSDPRAASSRNGWPGCWPLAPFTAITFAGSDGRKITSVIGTPPAAGGV